VGDPIDPGYLLPGTRIGFYRILSKVGAGGFGVLYRVERDGQSYALKIATQRRDEITPDEARTLEDRADRELVALKSLDHPNIVRVHAFERWPSLQDGYPFLIMDFVEGDRLNDWAAKTRPSLMTICLVFRKIALALHEMHGVEIHHRDLKSENVLVRRDGEPIIVDFGIARPLQARSVTRDHTFVGTSTHLAPEYCQYFSSEASQLGERFQFTPQADLHAVGFMLYELLAGRPPFPPCKDDLTMMLTIIRCVPAPAGQVNPAVPRSLESIVARLLEKDPGRRYANGQQLADALDAAVSQSDGSWTQPHAVPPPAGRDQPTRGDRLGGVPRSPAGVGPLISTDATTVESLLVGEIAQSMKRDASGVKPRRASSASRVQPAGIRMPVEVEGLPPARRRAKRSIVLGCVAVALLAVAIPMRLPRTVRSGASEMPLIPLPPPPAMISPRATGETLPAAPVQRTTATSVALRAREAGARARETNEKSAMSPATSVSEDREDRSVGISEGMRLPVRLITELEDRGLIGVSVEALLIRSVHDRNRHSLPAGTILYGVGTQGSGRFSLSFKRAKLPDERQLELDGLAFGIPPTRLRGGVAILAAGEEFEVLVIRGF
jgi:eukaryotic-like serine/threonine-protein kinase